MSTNEPTITIYEIDHALTKCEDTIILQRDRVDAHDRELATLHERCAKLEEIVFVLRATVRSIDESLPQLTRSHAPAPVFEPEGDDDIRDAWQHLHDTGLAYQLQSGQRCHHDFDKCPGQWVDGHRCRAGAYPEYFRYGELGLQWH